MCNGEHSKPTDVVAPNRIKQSEKKSSFFLFFSSTPHLRAKQCKKNPGRAFVVIFHRLTLCLNYVRFLLH